MPRAADSRPDRYFPKDPYSYISHMIIINASELIMDSFINFFRLKLLSFRAKTVSRRRKAASRMREAVSFIRKTVSFRQ